MDTIILVVSMLGASLMIALIFASTVLSLKWWNIVLILRHHRSKNNQQKQQENNRELIPQHTSVKVKSQSQNLVQLKRISSLNELINKKVRTCEMADVGNIVAIDKQSMTILHETKQQYIIPTYYIREYNTENVVTDISIRYLHHYKAEGIHSNLQK